MIVKTGFKIDGAEILNFLKTRKLVLENRDNQTIFDIQLLWFLPVLIFLSGFVIIGFIIALFLGCKISLINTGNHYINKD